MLNKKIFIVMNIIFNIFATKYIIYNILKHYDYEPIRSIF